LPDKFISFKPKLDLLYDFNGQIPRKELFKPIINSNADYEIKGDFDIIYEKNKKSQT